jgi:dihydropteroate synthase
MPLSESVLVQSKLGQVKVGDGEPVRILGVINTSPESFFAGSVASSIEEALSMAAKMAEQGADVVDVGGMSSAPYRSTLVSEEVEVARVVPVIKAISREMDLTISVDTFRSRVADLALSAGAAVVNDVTGLKGDIAMAKVVADRGASLIVSAKESRSSKRSGDPLTRVRAALEESLALAMANGVEKSLIVVDPAIGFFRNEDIKWYDWDAYVLRHLRRLATIGLPVNVGVSRKSFIGAFTGDEDPAMRWAGSLAAEAVAVVNGAHSIRTHDVGQTFKAVRVAEKLRPQVRSAASSGGLGAVELGPSLVAEDVEGVLASIGVQDDGRQILSRKGIFKVILVTNLPRPLALVAKQEMLALGGDVATPKDAILGGEGAVSVVVMGTAAQLEKLIRRLRRMSFSFLVAEGLPDAPQFADLLAGIVETSASA